MSYLALSSFSISASMVFSPTRPGSAFSSARNPGAPPTIAASGASLTSSASRPAAPSDSRDNVLVVNSASWPARAVPRTRSMRACPAARHARCGGADEAEWSQNCGSRHSCGDEGGERFEAVEREAKVVLSFTRCARSRCALCAPRAPVWPSVTAYAADRVGRSRTFAMRAR